MKTFRQVRPFLLPRYVGTSAYLSVTISLSSKSDMGVVGLANPSGSKNPLGEDRRD